MQVLTRDDLIRTGACWEGVNEWILEHCPDATALAVYDALRCAEYYKDEEALDYIKQAAELDGVGDGDDTFAYGVWDNYDSGYGYGVGYCTVYTTGRGESFSKNCDEFIDRADGQGVVNAYGRPFAYGFGECVGYGYGILSADGDGRGDGNGSSYGGN